MIYPNGTKIKALINNTWITGIILDYDAKSDTYWVKIRTSYGRAVIPANLAIKNS